MSYWYWNDKSKKYYSGGNIIKNMYYDKTKEFDSINTIIYYSKIIAENKNAEQKERKKEINERN